MSSKHHTADQIIAKLRRANQKLGLGKKIPEVCPIMEINVQTYYRRRQQYGGMQPSTALVLKALQNRECSLEEDSRGLGSCHGGLEGSRERKCVDLERRRRIVNQFRLPFGFDGVSQRLLVVA